VGGIQASSGPADRQVGLVSGGPFSFMSVSCPHVRSLRSERADQLQRLAMACCLVGERSEAGISKSLLLLDRLLRYSVITWFKDRILNLCCANGRLARRAKCTPGRRAAASMKRHTQHTVVAPVVAAHQH
jgi:hypothetical protein